MDTNFADFKKKRNLLEEYWAIPRKGEKFESSRLRIKGKIQGRQDPAEAT